MQQNLLFEPGPWWGIKRKEREETWGGAAEEEEPPSPPSPPSPVAARSLHFHSVPLSLLSPRTSDAGAAVRMSDCSRPHRQLSTCCIGHGCSLTLSGPFLGGISKRHCSQCDFFVRQFPPWSQCSLSPHRLPSFFGRDSQMKSDLHFIILSKPAKEKYFTNVAHLETINGDHQCEAVSLL